MKRRIFITFGSAINWLVRQIKLKGKTWDEVEERLDTSLFIILHDTRAAVTNSELFQEAPDYLRFHQILVKAVKKAEKEKRVLWALQTPEMAEAVLRKINRFLSANDFEPLESTAPISVVLDTARLEIEIKKTNPDLRVI